MYPFLKATLRCTAASITFPNDTVGEVMTQKGSHIYVYSFIYIEGHFALYRGIHKMSSSDLWYSMGVMLQKGSYICVYLSIYLSISIYIYLSVYPSIHRSIYLSTYLYLYMCIFIFISISISMSVSYLYKYICIPVYA